MKNSTLKIILCTFLLLQMSTIHAQDTYNQSTEITHFKVTSSGSTAKLTWDYFSADTGMVFGIERSRNRLIFEPLSSIEYLPNNPSLSFSYNDSPDQPGTYYYRINLYNIEGGGVYTNTLEVEIFPPSVYAPYYLHTYSTGSLLITANDNPKISVKMYDAESRELFSYYGPSEEMPAFSNHATGVYFYSIIIKNKMYSGKVFLP